MTMLQIRCPCGQTLRVQGDSVGRKCRCPTCGRELLVQAPRQQTSQPQAPRPAAPNPFTAGSAAPISRPAASALHRPHPQRRIAQRQRQTRVFLAAGFLLMLLLFAFGVAGTASWMLVRGGGAKTGDVVERFEPVEATPETTTASQPPATTVAGVDESDPLIQTAQRFIRLAAVPNSKGAIGLIDQDAFGQRVHGPDGSAAAVYNKVSTEKLLTNFRRVSLESTPGNGALRHWKVLGKTKFDGQDAVLVRYFSEVYPPVKWIRTDGMFNALIPLISMEEYWEATAKLDVLSPSTAGSFDISVPQRPDANGLLFPRAGYMLLCFEDINGQVKLVDVASAISRLRLSRASGELFLREWDVVLLGVRKKEELTAKPLAVSIFGELPEGMINEAKSYDSMADFRHYVDPNAKPLKDLPDLPPERQTNRTFRLTDIGSHLRIGSPRLSEKVDAFRRDFPSDIGADLVVVCLTMAKQNIEIKEGTGAAISVSAQRLYEDFADPFLLYVQWIVAKAENDRPRMARLQADLKASGFETAEMHRYWLEQAIASQDANQVRTALKDVARYWDPTSQLTAPELSAKVKQRWGHLSDRLAWQSEDLRQSGSRRRIGPFGPMGPGSITPPPPTRRPPKAGTDNRNSPTPFQPPRPPGRTRPPFNPPGPNPQAPVWKPEERVIISIDAESTFDINALAKGLQSKLGASAYSASRRNNQGTITLQHSGSLESVKAAIDFGVAEIESEDERRLRVRLTR